MEIVAEEHIQQKTEKGLNKTFLIILLGILAALGPFSIDMYLPGFSQIAQDLGTDEKKVAFTLTSYFIGIAVGQLIYGPLVDKYGRKKPLLAGLVIYAIASLAVALSTDIQVMIDMRLLQALGGCVGMVASNAIISDVYEIRQRAKAFSSIMLVMGVAPLIAPTVGSFFVVHLSWSYIFYFLAFFSLLVAGLIYLFLPETSRFRHHNKLRLKAISNDYLVILNNKMFLLYTLAGSLSMSILFAYISSASFVFLTFYELDKATFSALFAFNASGLIVGSYINGFLTKKYNYIKIAKIASIVLFIGSITACIAFLLFPALPYPFLIASIFSTLFIIGFINPNATAASLAPFTGNTGAASALGGSIRMGTGAMVAAAIGIFQGETALTMVVTIAILAILVTILLARTSNNLSTMVDK